MRLALPLTTIGLFLCSLAIGCRRDAAPLHATSAPREKHSDHEEERKGGENVTFHEGEGLIFSAEAAKALDLRFDKVSRQILQQTEIFSAQVFAITPPRILVSITVPAKAAETLRAEGFLPAKLLRVDHTASGATGKAELILEVELASPSRLGDKLEVSYTGPADSGLAVPRDALLDGARGFFVYRKNGDNFLRVAVVPGRREAGLVELTDGVQEDDTVVTRGVEQLWLIELRLTRGGGHSH